MTQGIERLVVTIGGRRVVLHRRRATVPDDAPALLLHALAGSWRWWRPTLRHLDRGRTILVPDRPGFGRSGGLPLAPADEADLLAGLLERLDAGARWHVAGHSMGGSVAAEFAARHPRRVASLALVDAAGWPTRLWPRYLGRLAQPWSWCRPGFLPTLVGDVLRTRPLRLAAGIRHAVAYDIRPALRAVRSPACVVWGARDRLLGPEQGRAIAESIGARRYEEMDGAGHIVPADRPAELAAILEEFWRTV